MFASGDAVKFDCREVAAKVDLAKSDIMKIDEDR